MARRFGLAGGYRRRSTATRRRRRGSGHAARQPGVVADDPDQPQAAVADDAGAQQRGRRHGGHAGRQTVDEPGRRHRVLGEAAVDVPAREQRVLAEVLLPAAAETAGLVGLVQPRHADAVAGGERRRARLAARRDELGAGSEGDDLADDLMAGHHGRAVRRQLALQDVQVGAADAAGQHPQQDLARTRLGHRELDEPERRLRRGSRRRQLHRAHRRGPVAHVPTSLTPLPWQDSVLLLVGHGRRQERGGGREEEQTELHGEQDAPRHEQRRQHDADGGAVDEASDADGHAGHDRPRPDDEERVRADRGDDEDLRRQEEHHAGFDE